jgi:nuclear pore complex protein Nup88
LDERVFNNNSHLEVLQVRWHPGSPSDSHLLVLLSDNSIRVYDEFTLRHIWRIGPVPSALPPTGSSLPFLNSLGDTAVDFDVAPPRVVDTERDGKGLNLSLMNVSIGPGRKLNKLFGITTLSLLGILGEQEQ